MYCAVNIQLSLHIAQAHSIVHEVTAQPRLTQMTFRVRRSEEAMHVSADKALLLIATLATRVAGDRYIALTTKGTQALVNAREVGFQNPPSGVPKPPR